MGAPLSSRSLIRATYSAALLPWTRDETGWYCNLFSRVGYDGVVIDEELKAGVFLVSPLVHLDPVYQPCLDSSVVAGAHLISGSLVLVRRTSP